MEKTYICSNGVPLYTYRNDALHSFHLSLFFKAGTLYEDASECGITHFFEHVAIRNVNKIIGGDMYRELDRRGVEFNASTYSEMIQFYTGGETDSLPFSASLITKVLSPISLSAGELAKERKRIKAEIRESDDRNSSAFLSGEIVHSGTSLSNSILGNLRSIDKINLKKLNQYREKISVRGNFFFYLTGNYREEDLDCVISEIENLEAYDGEIRDNLAPVSNYFFNRQENVIIKNSPDTSVRFTFDVDMAKCPMQRGDLIYDILFGGYASPFFIKMSEEEGLFYDITSSSERYKNIGNLSLAYEVKEKELYSSLKMALEIFKDFKESVLSEIDLMKTPYVKNSSLLLDDARELAFTFAYDNHIMELGYKSVADRAEAYEKITGEEVMTSAREIFTPKNLTLFIKGKKKKIDKAKIEEMISEILK